MNCDTCGKPCGDGSVPVINDAAFVVGYLCRYCADNPPALCMHWECIQVATLDYEGRGYCQAHYREERGKRLAQRANYLRGGAG